MKTVTITYQGDAYDITSDLTGQIVDVTVRRDNSSRVPAPLNPEDVPYPVLHKMRQKERMHKNEED